MVNFFKKIRSRTSTLTTIRLVIAIVLLSAMALWQDDAKAGDEQETPDPLAWAQSLDSKAFDDKISFLNCISLWTNLKKNQQHWLDLGNSTGAVSFIKFFPQSGFLFQSRLLREPPPQDLDTPPDSPNGTPINGMLVEKGKTLSLIYWSQKHQEKKTNLGRWPTPQGGFTNPEELLDFLREKLGYDGVVLAEKGPFILVGFILTPKKESQALLLSDSNQKIKIDAKTPKGRALLQILKIKAGYGVLERLLAKDQKQTIPIGSKVLLGRGK